MNLNDLAVIILAAGRGTRFGESYTKLLHPIFDKPLIYYPIQNLKNLNVQNIIVVVSDPKVEEEVRKYINCDFAYMEKPTGTADAVKVALPKIPKNVKTLLVLNGDDATLYSKKTLEEFLDSHNEREAKISMMTLLTKRKMEVGRIVRNSDKKFSKILEYKEYQESGIKSQEINCGVYLIDLEFAKENLPNIQRSQSGENYLTDLLNIAKEKGEGINLFVLKDHSQWIGINDKKDLKYAMTIIKRRQISFDQSGGGEKLQKNISVHFLGIAGSGTSACAKLAEAAGFKISGCDKNLSGEFTETLKDIQTFEGHSPNHLEGVDILAVTPAVLSLDPKNPELQEAKKRKIKIMTWQKFLGKYLTANKFVIAVSGTHGKSTTTAMVGKILEDAGLDPTVLLGATTSFWKTNFRIPDSISKNTDERSNLRPKEYFVIEADEFNNNFLSLNPDATVLTNIEFDHPEYFKDFEDYKNSFLNFLAKTKRFIIANLNDENSRNILEERVDTEKIFPPVVDYSKNLIDFPLKVTGEHNRLNGSAAFNLALNLEIAPEKIRQSLQNYQGIGRRMELIGQINGAKIFSDFAHHPTAIKVATEQIKKQFPDKNIWVIYQPHMFSRTKALFAEFVKVFKNLKIAGVRMLDIYPSREKDTGLIKTKDLVNVIRRDNTTYAKDIKDVINEMKPTLSGKDIVIFMGAGDIDSKIRVLLQKEGFSE